ncbi:hypothetical protein AgCh_021428 [Apium graveolens]
MSNLRPPITVPDHSPAKNSENSDQRLLQLRRALILIDSGTVWIEFYMDSTSGREASIVAELVEVEAEGNSSTTNMRTLRIPPVITVNKSAAYASYELTYIRDVSYKPEELYVKTRKCEPDAGCEMSKVILLSTLSLPVALVGMSVECLHHVEISEVIVGPNNRTAISNDKFLRANLIGDYVGYTNIPSFDEYYLVIPRQGGPGQPNSLGTNFTRWMLLERVRFTLDGLECNKIGVSYEAFNGQPVNHSSLLQNAGSRSFSIGITEVLNTNLLIELTADDIEYVYQRSPGKIVNITVPTFEALTQFGAATITTKNIGEVEASYSLTWYLNKYLSLIQSILVAAILKDSEFSEVDRAECQFTTTSTNIDNGSQIAFQPPKSGIKGFLESIEIFWKSLWDGMTDFVTGKSCRGDARLSQVYLKKHYNHDVTYHQVDMKRKHKSIHGEHKHKPLEHSTDHRHHLHHGHKEKHTHHRTRNSSLIKQTPLDNTLDDIVGHQRHGKERESVERLQKSSRHTDEIGKEFHKHKRVMDGTQSKFHSKRNFK